MVRNRYIFKMYYIGKKKYYGSQRQLYFLTIESCILKVLKNCNYIKSIKTSGFEVASRTDKFVSARGAIFSIITEKYPTLMEINSKLPKEIGIWAYGKVPLDFSSRYNALFRHYKYIVPLTRLRLDLNFELMNQACKTLEGNHNFKNFSKREKKEVNTVRDLDLVEMKVDEGYIIFDFMSKSFLRQQIRRMVKKILEVGVGTLDFNDFLLLFDNSKNISYQPENPKGLILWDIKYKENVKLKEDQKSKERMEDFFFEQQCKNEYNYQLFRVLKQNNLS